MGLGKVGDQLVDISRRVGPSAELVHPRQTPSGESCLGHLSRAPDGSAARRAVEVPGKLWFLQGEERELHRVA